MSKKYKYTATFDNVVFASSDIEKSSISKASLESLRPLIPQDINLEKNIDLYTVKIVYVTGKKMYKLN